MEFFPWIAGGAVVLSAAAYLLYKHFLHPSWRRERRVRRVCDKAFADGDYRLVRLRLQVEAPSGTDLFRSLLPGSSESTRYFTYRIETDADPDLSGLSHSERSLLRHYLNRPAASPHHGREVLRPASNSPDTTSRHTAPGS